MITIEYDPATHAVVPIAELCPICGADEPRTGTCGSNDPRALCNRAAPAAPAQQDALQQCINLANRRLLQPPSELREIDFIAALGWIRDALKDYQRAAPAQPVPALPTGRAIELKTDPQVFTDVFDGRKTFEIRYDDRGFEVGDELLLRETAHTGMEMRNGAPLVYTEREVAKRIGHIMRGPAYGLADGWIIASFADGAQSSPAKHIGYFNIKYGTFFKLPELAATDRNAELLASGEIIKVYSDGAQPVGNPDKLDHIADAGEMPDSAENCNGCALIREWAVSSWSRGHAAGVHVSKSILRQVTDALEHERAAHMETNRVMTEALTQAEAAAQSVPDHIGDANEKRLAYCVRHGFPQLLSTGWWGVLPNGNLVRGAGPIEAIDAAMAEGAKS